MNNSASGTSPSARAAHGAVCIEPYKIVIYGGATGTGGLASDDLFHLQLKEGVGVWNVINVKDRTPGKRYGHTLSYSKPYLIVFGGNVGQRSVNDCWLLNIMKQHVAWEEIVCEGAVPCPRVYHSAALGSQGIVAGMIVVFGGRDHEGNPLADSWGLRRHRTGKWDWVAAPQKSRPTARYQHTSIFVGPLMLVIGGRKNTISEGLPLEVFNTDSAEWTVFQSIQRFRHSSWLQDKSVMVYGGFQLSAPNVPTDSIARINLMTLFANKPALIEKLNSMQLQNGSPPASPSTSPSRNQASRERTTAPSTPNMREIPRKEGDEGGTRKKMVIMEAVVGGEERRRDPQRRPNMVGRQDIPNYFLDQLMQPSNFMNAESINIEFRPQQIHMLCNLAEEVLMRQPIVLQARTPLKVFGDLHGQFTDLMSFFSLYGAPHENGRKKDIESFDYIFLGDFVDRGNHSLETICLLLALKCLYPEQVHLIRGNHEDIQINTSFGFRDQCQTKLSQNADDQRSVFMRINRLFEWLPLATVIEDKILCLHGGIGESLHSLASIHAIKRPLEVMHEVEDKNSKIILDILWSDPTPTDNDLGILPNHLRDPSNMGNIVQFGPDRVHDFLKKNNLQMIIRAHECVMDGFQRFAKGALITVFSATDYCRKHKNAGAILIIKTNFEIVAKLIYPTNSNANNWIQDDEQLNRRPPTPPRWREHTY